VFGMWPDTKDPKAAVIWEAFKPESEPRRIVRREEMIEAAKAAALARLNRGAARQAVTEDSDFLQSQGGIY